MKDNCLKCFGCNACLSAALDNKTMRCIDFGDLKRAVDECVDKISELPLEHSLSHEEIKELIYCTNRRC